MTPLIVSLVALIFGATAVVLAVIIFIRLGDIWSSLDTRLARQERRTTDILRVQQMMADDKARARNRKITPSAVTAADIASAAHDAQQPLDSTTREYDMRPRTKEQFQAWGKEHGFVPRPAPDEHALLMAIRSGAAVRAQDVPSTWAIYGTQTDSKPVRNIESPQKVHYSYHPSPSHRLGPYWVQHGTYYDIEYHTKGTVGRLHDVKSASDVSAKLREGEVLLDTETTTVYGHHLFEALNGMTQSETSDPKDDAKQRRDRVDADAKAAGLPYAGASDGTVGPETEFSIRVGMKALRGERIYPKDLQGVRLVDQSSYRENIDGTVTQFLTTKGIAWVEFIDHPGGDRTWHRYAVTRE